MHWVGGLEMLCYRMCSLGLHWEMGICKEMVEAAAPGYEEPTTWLEHSELSKIYNKTYTIIWWIVVVQIGSQAWPTGALSMWVHVGTHLDSHT